MQKSLQNNCKISISTISIRTFRESINGFNAENISRRFVRSGELLEGLVRPQTARGGCTQLCACDLKQKPTKSKRDSTTSRPTQGLFNHLHLILQHFSCSFLKLKLGGKIWDQLHWCHHQALIYAVQWWCLRECLQSYAIINVKLRISLVMNMTIYYTSKTWCLMTPLPSCKNQNFKNKAFHLTSVQPFNFQWVETNPKV